ncbi:MAG: APC family permease [Bacteriovoracia bacterium]
MTNLVRGLGFTSALLFVINSSVGAGIFIVASEMAKIVPSPGLILLVWFAAGVISLIGGLVVAELGAMFPESGGPYNFLKEAFHPALGFLFGWAQILVVLPGSVAGVSIAFAKFTSKLIPLDPLQMKLTATALLTGLTILNTFGLKKGAKLGDIVTPTKMIAIIGFAIAGVFFAKGQPISFDFVSENSNDSWATTLSSFSIALIGAFWAFDGWAYLSFIAGEVKNPKKTIPLALALGLTTVTLLYLIPTWTYYRVLPYEAITGSEFVAADAAQVIAGPLGAKIMALLVAISALGCANSVVIAGARMSYAMASSGTFPKFFSKVDPKTLSPNRSLVFQLCWTLVLVWSGSFAQLLTYVIFAEYLFYGLNALALIRLRISRPSVNRPFKIPFYPILPALYIAFIIAFSMNSIIKQPAESLTGLGLILLGLPFYAYITKKHKVK